MKIGKFIIILITLLLLSCKNNDKPQTAKYKNLYTLQLPGHLTKTDELNDDASLQYKNEFREFYTIVIHEPKSELNTVLKKNYPEGFYTPDLKGYTDILINGIDENIIHEEKTTTQPKTINGLPANVAELSGLSDGLEIFIKIAFIEGKDNYYQVMVWTLANKKNEHLPAMNTIIDSFTETNKSRK